MTTKEGYRALTPILADYLIYTSKRPVYMCYMIGVYAIMQFVIGILISHEGITNKFFCFVRS
jgi:hypothetical protein